MKREGGTLFCVCGDESSIRGRLGEFMYHWKQDYDVHFNTSACPGLSNQQLGTKKNVLQNNSRTQDKYICHCVTGMVKQLLDLIQRLNQCVTLE